RCISFRCSCSSCSRLRRLGYHDDHEFCSVEATVRSSFVVGQHLSVVDELLQLGRVPANVGDLLLYVADLVGGVHPQL
ncbi:hypothetical protein PFISCL1PPCAC_4778, partial [Pristionchus fissidentatus]